MFIMTPQFKDYLFDKFQGWEKTQPKKRSSFSAFARWLSENSFHTLGQHAHRLPDWLAQRDPAEVNLIMSYLLTSIIVTPAGDNYSIELKYKEN